MYVLYIRVIRFVGSISNLILYMDFRKEDKKVFFFCEMIAPPPYP